jgi:hypothetical protein
MGGLTSSGGPTRRQAKRAKDQAEKQTAAINSQTAALQAQADAIKNQPSPVVNIPPPPAVAQPEEPTPPPPVATPAQAQSVGLKKAMLNTRKRRRGLAGLILTPLGSSGGGISTLGG